MFDIGWTELMVIGIVALIVVGPQDLPRMFAALGRFTAKARSMGREFQRAMDDAAKETGVGETARDLRNMTSKKNLGLDKIEGAAKKFESWDPSKTGTKPASAASSAKAGSETARLAEQKAAEGEARRAAAAAPKATQPAKAAPGAKKPAPKVRAAAKSGAAKPRAKAAAPKPAAKADDA